MSSSSQLLFSMMTSSNQNASMSSIIQTEEVQRGVRRVCGVDEADCACVSEAVVLAEEEREAVSLRIRAARLASSRLPGSLKLFDDRTGQHHRRDPFKLFKEVVCYSQAPRPAARRARAGCRKRK
eukprot:superscaffoldBa00003251_g16478